MLRSTELRNVPDCFSDFNCWLLVKGEALDSGCPIVNEVTGIRETEENLFDEI